MIARLRPYVGREELKAIASIRRSSGAVRAFEAEFANTFDTTHAIAFSYGRSALWALFKAVGLADAEVVQPAYSCVVVAHATVLSGNIPRFVDISAADYNMDLDEVEAAITPRTGAIIPTHLFGYPLDIDRLDRIVAAAEARYGRKIFVIHDCAHAFGARWQGRLVCREGDAALFGLGISKLLTSIVGGMLTTNDGELAERLRAWRDSHFSPATVRKDLWRRLYLAACYLAFARPLYGFVRWLDEETPLLDRLTKAYHLDGQIHFPPDYLQQMSAAEAQVGVVQLRKYERILEKRRDCARYYHDALGGVAGLRLPPLVEGATYSHYVLRVSDRNRLIRGMRRKGVQLGRLIDYSIPHMSAYRPYAGGGEFPNALRCSQESVNLPIHASLSTLERERVVQGIADVCSVPRQPARYVVT
jgi:dTDP-4-amino-4,6-dideoxygalactose transaminase